MPDKQKAIEEMTEAIPYDIIRYDQKPKGQHLYWEQRKEIAVALVNANYGNIPQALTEFAERVIYKIGLLWNANGNNSNIRCAQEMVCIVAKDFGINVKTKS